MTPAILLWVTAQSIGNGKGNVGSARDHILVHILRNARDVWSKRRIHVQSPAAMAQPQQLAETEDKAGSLAAPALPFCRRVDLEGEVQ
jgi:hypothetical protein